MNSIKKVLFFWLLLVAINTTAQTYDAYFEQTNTFLKTYVSNGKVAYKEIKNDQKALSNLVEMAAMLPKPSPEDKAYGAFYINTYNILVIQGVVSQYPIASPLDVKGFFDSITYTVAGETLTLNTIENKKIRPVLKDARIHFVLVCGAIGCPVLTSEVYTPSNLNNQLEKQTRIALNDSNFIKQKGKKIYVSELFKWYKEDFVAEKGDILSYINTYRDVPFASKTKVTFYTYNWNLNSK